MAANLPLCYLQRPQAPFNGFHDGLSVTDWGRSWECLRSLHIVHHLLTFRSLPDLKEKTFVRTNIMVLFLSGFFHLRFCIIFRR